MQWRQRAWPVLELGVDLLGQVGAGRLVGPGVGVAPVEVDRLLLEPRPVLVLRVNGVLQQLQSAAVVRFQCAQRGEPALLGGAHVGRRAQTHQQVRADVLA